MKKIIATVFFGMLLSACSSFTATQKNVKNVNEIAPYPNPIVGYSKFVVNVPSLTKEDDVRVELLVGKEMNVDCNIHQLVGSITPKELVGWGYSYYVVDLEENSGFISTKMACPEVSDKSQFVTIKTNLDLVPYNSNLPVVVYAPSEFQVKYRVWKLDGKVSSATIE